MEIHNIDLKVLIWGTIYDCRVTIEGYNVGLWQQGKTAEGQLYLFRSLPNFPTDNDINFFLIARGIHGAQIDLEIKVDGRDIKNIMPCKINNGIGTISYNLKTLLQG